MVTSLRAAAYPVVEVAAALPEHDLLVLRIGDAVNERTGLPSTMPVNPYPPPADTGIAVRFMDPPRWAQGTILG